MLEICFHCLSLAFFFKMIFIALKISRGGVCCMPAALLFFLEESTYKISRPKYSKLDSKDVRGVKSVTDGQT